MFYHKTFMDMMVYRSAGNRKPAHLMAHPVSSFVLAQEQEIAIYQGVHKQTISGYPLFIAPITCWLLCNHVPVRRALILHPCQGFTDSILEKIMLTCYFSKNANTQQKQRSCIT